MILSKLHHTMIRTNKNMDEFEDLIFNFREYPIQSELDFQSALADYRLSKELIEIVINLKATALKEIVSTDNKQIAQFCFEFLIQSLTKNNVILFTNIINYTVTNQTTIV